MTSREILSELRRCPGTVLGSSLRTEEVERALADFGVELPLVHREILRQANGIEAYGGYFRLFGICPGELPHLQWWNSTGTWKFAWGDRVGEYLCFGETAWGDQYAYRRSGLGVTSDPRVYFLESITMTPEVIADSFSGFWQSEFMRNASAPYDEVLVEVRRRLGDLKPNEHVLYQPSLLLGGEESAENVQKMPAVVAMIVNGDLSRQLAAELQSRPVKEIQAVEDSEGRMRLKVVWGDAPE